MKRLKKFNNSMKLSQGKLDTCQKVENIKPQK